MAEGVEDSDGIEVRDVTPERESEKKRGALELALAKECFPGKQVKFSQSMTNYITISNVTGRVLADKNAGLVRMDVYDESVLPQAKEFGRKYKAQFGVGHFVIETDYSKKE